MQSCEALTIGSAPVGVFLLNFLTYVSFTLAHIYIFMYHLVLRIGELFLHVLFVCMCVNAVAKTLARNLREHVYMRVSVHLLRCLCCWHGRAVKTRCGL